MQRISLTLKSPIEASPGKSLERTERYEYEPAKFGLSVYPLQPTKDPEVWVRSNMSYGNVESIVAFAAYRQKENDKAAAAASSATINANDPDCGGDAAYASTRAATHAPISRNPLRT